MDDGCRTNAAAFANVVGSPQNHAPFFGPSRALKILVVSSPPALTFFEALGLMLGSLFSPTSVYFLVAVSRFNRVTANLAIGLAEGAAENLAWTIFQRFTATSTPFTVYASVVFEDVDLTGANVAGKVAIRGGSEEGALQIEINHWAFGTRGSVVNVMIGVLFPRVSLLFI
jgi:hypothetical protein